MARLNICCLCYPYPLNFLGYPQISVYPRIHIRTSLFEPTSIVRNLSSFMSVYMISVTMDNFSFSLQVRLFPPPRPHPCTPLTHPICFQIADTTPSSTASNPNSYSTAHISLSPTLRHFLESVVVSSARKKGRRRTGAGRAMVLTVRPGDGLRQLQVSARVDSIVTRPTSKWRLEYRSRQTRMPPVIHV